MSKPLVLVVDDSMDDLILVQMAAKKIAAPVDWRAIDTGEEALSYLAGEGVYSDRESHPVPHLVIVDLKMPRISGFDILSRLQATGSCKPPFVCVMTSSGLKTDIEKATALGADVFHTKPSDFDSLCSLLQRLTGFFCLARHSAGSNDVLSPSNN